MMQILNSSFELQSSEFSKLVADSGNCLENFLKRSEIGFPKIPDRSELWLDASATGKSLGEKFETMVVVGIGGSSLGVRALVEIFGSVNTQKKILFCDNVDSHEFAKLWSEIKELNKTCWVFISKSGSTIETLVAADFISQKIGDNFSAVVVSEKVKNPLTLWAESRAYPCLEIPRDVGGRFSVLASVGMLPMAFLGIDINEFRSGAQLAMRDKRNLATIISVIRKSFESECWISFFWYYNSAYLSFGRWVQQLWAESLAKKVDRQGRQAPRVSTPMWGIGACDQHSLLQQLMEGHKDKLIIFNRFEDLESDKNLLNKSMFESQKFFLGHSMGQLFAAQAQGTCEALNSEGAHTLSLRFKDSSAKSIGYQFMFWQLVVAGLGESLNIDAFNQPGVELGKRLAKDILKA